LGCGLSLKESRKGSEKFFSKFLRKQNHKHKRAMNISDPSAPGTKFCVRVPCFQESKPRAAVPQQERVAARELLSFSPETKKKKNNNQTQPQRPYGNGVLQNRNMTPPQKENEKALFLECSGTGPFRTKKARRMRRRARFFLRETNAGAQKQSKNPIGGA